VLSSGHVLLRSIIRDARNKVKKNIIVLLLFDNCLLWIILALRPIARISQHGGTKTTRGGAHFFKYNIGCIHYAATGGPNIKWEARILNGVPGTTGPLSGDGSACASSC